VQSTVGFNVGADVGPAVGAVVELGVSANVGPLVGFAVGLEVGADVGPAVGLEVGLDVGPIVGEVVGLPVRGLSMADRLMEDGEIAFRVTKVLPTLQVCSEPCTRLESRVAMTSDVPNS